MAELESGIGSGDAEVVEALGEPGEGSSQDLDEHSLEVKERSWGASLVTFFILAIPASLIGVLVYLYGVDTPWGDQWDGTLPFLEKLDAGTARLADLYAFHHEHRILFPRLIAVSLAKLTHWNIRAELLVIWIMACVCSFNVWRISVVTGCRDERWRDWLLLGANVILFTLVQWENLLWGFQIGFFLPLVCVTACVWIGPSVRHPWCLLLTSFFCVISTFSVASGFCCWILTAPLLLLSRDEIEARPPRLWWLSWLAIGAATTFLCFQDCVSPEGHPSIFEAFNHPLNALLFTLAYLGTPFWGSTPDMALPVPVLAGAVQVALFAACLRYLWRYRSDRALLKQAVPWVSLAGWTFANALLTMFGRVGFGVRAAMMSRYASFVIMLPIGLLFLGSLLFKHSGERSKIKGSPGRGWVWVAIFGAALVSFFLYASISSLGLWKVFQHRRLSGKAALLLVNVVDEPSILARNVHAGEIGLKPRTNFLNRMGYLRPPLVSSKNVREIAYRSGGTGDSESVGEFERIVKSADDEYTVSGWAILPDRHRAADGVILTYDDAEGQPMIFALAEVGYKRADVRQRLKDPTYFRCGWTKSWKRGQVPAGVRRIRAWTFDAERCRAFEIDVATLE